jgi:ABC-2 type transport system ATP-binding protein
MEEAQQLCNEIVIVDRGRIIASGVPVELVKTHLAAVVVRLPINDWPAGKPLPEDGELRSGFIEIFADQAPPLLQRLEDAGAKLHGLKVETPNLEDLFLKLTGHALRS